MRNSITKTVSIIMVIACLICLASCQTKIDKSGLWENAVYLEDTELGSGNKTLLVEVKVEDKSINFTIKTDKQTVGDALIENGLISGEGGQYGLYIKAVNGITADYNIDKSFWAFYVNNEYALSGVDLTEIDESAKYQLVYTK